MTHSFDRRRFIASVGALASLASLPRLVGAATTPKEEWPPFRSTVVIDGCGMPGAFDASDTAPIGAAEIADIRNGGVTGINLTVSSVGSYANDFDQTLRNIAYWDARIAAHPEAMMKVVRGSMLDEAKRSGKLGVIFGFQDTTMYGENLDRFDVFHDLGVRIIQLTYNRRNLMGDGCMEPGNAGVSRLGNELVERMNARGALVDLSHCGQRTTREGIQASKQPVAITHSGCAAVADSPRNKRDEELRLLAERGGVIGIYIMPYLRKQGQVMAEDVVRHIDYAVNICGEDHVGIGTDGMTSDTKLTDEFKKTFADQVADRQKRGIAAPGERADSYVFALDLNTPMRFERIAVLLSKKGYSDSRIGKILGGNFARLFRDVIV